MSHDLYHPPESEIFGTFVVVILIFSYAFCSPEFPRGHNGSVGKLKMVLSPTLINIVANLIKEAMSP